MAKKIFIIILMAVCLWSITGSMVLAADSPGGLVTCGRTGDAKTQATDCDFIKLMDMINKILEWAVTISTSLAAIAFAYAGWLYLTAGDNPGQVSKAKHVFVSVGIGFALVLAGWLVFKLIADNFLSSNYGTYLS